MRFLILIVFLFSSASCISQTMIYDSIFYENGKLKSYGKYDSIDNVWIIFNYYEDGQIERKRKLSPVYFWDVDSSIVYHRNGKIAWIFPYTADGLLSGRLVGWYVDGELKKEGFYYKGFKNGTWTEYYKGGKSKSISFYQVDSSDMRRAHNITLQDYLLGLAEEDCFTWGELNDNYLFKNLREGEIRFVISTLVSRKIGEWKSFDINGKLRNKKITEFENTVYVRQLIGKYGLSLEQVKVMFEKSNSLEDLAQLIEDNIIGEGKSHLIKYWHESEQFLSEGINKPRKLLGLSELEFKD